ncbi:cystathionine beta-synthase-like [Cydia strobilella]|uniref:cystathionine beta-synthase-like n=1 Tax=Cydia strobilella TaxID=1100964 RepID=UPI003006B440
MYSAKAKHISYGNWKPAGRDAKVYDNILQVVGNTPLVKLNRIPKDYGVECEIYAKCEFLNPGGSIKDRIAKTLVHDAEKSGRAYDGTRFVEPTSGNTGIGLALTAAVKAGYKATIVTPDKNAGEKLSTLKLLEADIVQTPTSANLGDPDHFLTVAQEILKQDPNSISLDQFSNPVNPMTHEEHTGSEIVAALGHVDMAVMGAGTGGTVMGAGTGGTVTGIARALKKACPECVIVAVEAVGSIIWGSELAPFYVEGIGDDFVPDVLEKDVIDKVVHTNDYDSFNMAREIIRKEGLLCGGSSGAAMFAALQVANELKLGAGKKVVVVFPDGIRNYMTKFVADQWMEAHLFKEPPLHPNIEWWNHPIDNLPVSRVILLRKMSNHVASQNGQANGLSKFFNLKELPHIVKVLDRNQKFHPDILHAIGNTPLVKLTRIPKSEGIKCDMYAKCEFMNPGGSVKDRIAYRMVLDAEQRGVLKPGKSVIIEPTSGNTGIGLALAAAVKGYRCIIVLPEKMSDEKVNTLRALGAEIVRTPTEAPSSSPESNIGVAHRMASEIPDAVVLDQYNNPCNPLAHYDGTAEEILWALDDAVDMVVMGAGTSGTVSGVAHKLKERCPACTVVAVDPYGSILAQPEELNHSDVDMYEVEGIGYDFLPRTLDRTVIDKWVKCDDQKALPMARRLIQEEGLLCGGSSGSAMWGALQAAKSLKEGQKCVVLLPDNIRNYMTKHISDPWMEARQFKPVPTNDKLWWWDSIVEPSLTTPVASVPLSSTPAQALSALSPSVPLVTVVRDDGSVAGVCTADDARRRLANLSGSTSEGLDKFLVKKYYKVDLAKNPTLGLVSRMLDIAPYVVVVNTDASSHSQHVVGVITSNNLLALITDKAKMINGIN